ncbi:hypothetical protein KP509_12G093400 [Ceratopteris richardii]|uniref:EF-hand domain-containing protein n=1 Tax=Ceratopteris richardii TaxID=49495 RepID=A0A8T2TRX1_CERRI|nr:hypothetical protein KP509_12G093400 [Ceratopteris richardii]
MKAAFVYLFIALCFIAFVLYSNQPHRLKSKVHRNLHAGRRLVIRKLSIGRDSKHENVAFDPIVASFERKREDRTWEKEYFQEQFKQWSKDSEPGHTHESAPHPQSQPEPAEWDYKDPEDFLNDEEHFNVSSRILTLFPLIDNHPSDGRISLDELQDWHLQAALTEAEHRAIREMEHHDKNHDGMVSFAEYLPHSELEDEANRSMEHGGVGWWKEQFDTADEDGDGLLNAKEFNNFLHPQDSRNPKLHEWLRKQEIRERDHDKDGKLNFKEFEEGIYDIIKLHDEGEALHSSSDSDSSARREANAKRRFLELDKNKDGFLTEDELVPIMDNLHPGEAYYAKQQAEYLISQADTNKDGYLTIEEMLENPYIFYSTAFAYEDYEEYYHDEF